MWWNYDRRGERRLIEQDQAALNAPLPPRYVAEGFLSLMGYSFEGLKALDDTLFRVIGSDSVSTVRVITNNPETVSVRYTDGYREKFQYDGEIWEQI